MTPTCVDLREASHGFADAAVIERVLRGETQAFEELVRRYQQPLYRHAAAMVLDHDAAADMVQDAFIRAFTNLDTCRDRGRFRAWLFQTLRNRCLDYLKEAQRRTVALDEAAPIADSGEGPGAAVERARTRGAIEEALLALPHEQREAFVLHYVDGLPYDAMADLLQTSVSALKMRVLRARGTLSTALVARGVSEGATARLSLERG